MVACSEEHFVLLRRSSMLFGSALNFFFIVDFLLFFAASGQHHLHRHLSISFRSTHLSHRLSTEKCRGGICRTFQVHECKTEATLLDIWRARGRSRPQGQRNGRWRENITVDFPGIYSELLSLRWCHSKRKRGASGLFKPRGNLY